MTIDSTQPAAPSCAASITIVIPVHNVASYVRDAIESVRRQSVAPDEVIVVDDGSTDESGTIVAEYAHLPGFRLVTTRNNGLGPARNLGRMLAKSDYVYFFDSDDLMVDCFVERMKHIIRDNDFPDVVLFGGRAFRDADCTHDFSPDYQRRVSGTYRRGDKLIATLVKHGEAFTQPCLYVTKTLLWAEHRLAFPPVIHEDTAVFLPLLASSTRTVVSRETLFLRRIRSGSIMTRGRDGRSASGILRAIHETKEFMNREPVLVSDDLSMWRKSLGYHAVLYIQVCRQTSVRCDFLQASSALIASRSPKHVLLAFYRFLHGFLVGFIRMFKGTRSAFTSREGSDQQDSETGNGRLLGLRQDGGPDAVKPVRSGTRQ